MKVFATLAVALGFLALSTVLNGCSLATPDTHRLRIAVPGITPASAEAKAARAAMISNVSFLNKKMVRSGGGGGGGSSVPPADRSFFNCFGVTVTAPDIQDDRLPGCSQSVGPVGVLGGFGYLLGDSGYLEVKVPAGSGRLIRVFAIESKNGYCPSLDEIYKDGTDNLGEPYVVGRTTVDLLEDADVSIDLSYDPLHTERPFDCGDQGKHDVGIPLDHIVKGTFNQSYLPDLHVNLMHSSQVESNTSYLASLGAGMIPQSSSGNSQYTGAGDSYFFKASAAGEYPVVQLWWDVTSQTFNSDSTFEVSYRVGGYWSACHASNPAVLKTALMVSTGDRQDWDTHVRGVGSMRFVRDGSLYRKIQFSALSHLYALGGKKWIVAEVGGPIDEANPNSCAGDELAIVGANLYLYNTPPPMQINISPNNIGTSGSPFGPFYQGQRISLGIWGGLPSNSDGMSYTTSINPSLSLTPIAGLSSGNEPEYTISNSAAGLVSVSVSDSSGASYVSQTASVDLNVITPAPFLALRKDGDISVGQLGTKLSLVDGCNAATPLRIYGLNSSLDTTVPNLSVSKLMPWIDTSSVNWSTGVGIYNISFYKDSNCLTPIGTSSIDLGANSSADLIYLWISQNASSGSPVASGYITPHVNNYSGSFIVPFYFDVPVSTVTTVGPPGGRVGIRNIDAWVAGGSPPMNSTAVMQGAFHSGCNTTQLRAVLTDSSLSNEITNSNAGATPILVNLDPGGTAATNYYFLRYYSSSSCDLASEYINGQVSIDVGYSRSVPFYVAIEAFSPGFSAGGIKIAGTVGSGSNLLSNGMVISPLVESLGTPPYANTASTLTRYIDWPGATTSLLGWDSSAFGSATKIAVQFKLQGSPGTAYHRIKFGQSLLVTGSTTVSIYSDVGNAPSVLLAGASNTPVCDFSLGYGVNCEVTITSPSLSSSGVYWLVIDTGTGGANALWRGFQAGANISAITAALPYFAWSATGITGSWNVISSSTSGTKNFGLQFDSAP